MKRIIGPTKCGAASPSPGCPNMPYVAVSIVSEHSTETTLCCYTHLAREIKLWARSIVQQVEDWKANGVQYVND
jgi:hypothetical protein